MYNYALPGDTNGFGVESEGNSTKSGVIVYVQMLKVG